MGHYSHTLGMDRVWIANVSRERTGEVRTHTPIVSTEDRLYTAPTPTERPAPMTYRLVYLPTGRSVKDSEGNVRTVEAKSERAAKLRFAKMLGYVNWELHTVYVCE